MLALNLPPDIVERLSELAAKTGQSRDRVVREAILTYLDDLEDAVIALERLRSGEDTITLEEVERQFQSERNA